MFTLLCITLHLSASKFICYHWPTAGNRAWQRNGQVVWIVQSEVRRCSGQEFVMSWPTSYRCEALYSCWAIRASVVLAELTATKIKELRDRWWRDKSFTYSDSGPANQTGLSWWQNVTTWWIWINMDEPLATIRCENAIYIWIGEWQVTWQPGELSLTK